MENYKNLTKEQIAEIEIVKKDSWYGFPITGTNYYTMEEAIAILKNNKKMTRMDWLRFFSVFLGNFVKDFNYLDNGILKDRRDIMTEEEYLSYATECVFPFNYVIPKYTVEELFQKIDSIPAFTEEEIREKYTGDQLTKALSFIKREKLCNKAIYKGLKTVIIPINDYRYSF